MGSGFSGNAYTAHGRVREPEIARMGRRDPRHPALVAPCSTPSSRSGTSPPPTAIGVDARGPGQLCEIKTTNKSWRSIPRSYLRQVWWQQHVLGAERTLVAWEEHDAFVPVGDEPRCAWVDRDEAEIAKLVRPRDRADRRAAPAHDGRAGDRTSDAGPLHASRAGSPTTHARLDSRERRSASSAPSPISSN